MIKINARVHRFRLQVGMFERYETTSWLTCWVPSAGVSRALQIKELYACDDSACRAEVQGWEV